jgi:hypothetical protein
MGVFVAFSRIFLLGILIVEGLTARSLCKLFGVKGLTNRISGWTENNKVIEDTS